MSLRKYTMSNDIYSSWYAQEGVLLNTTDQGVPKLPEFPPKRSLNQPCVF